jgi:omega-amidase
MLISLVQSDVVWEDAIANRLKLDGLLEPLEGQTDLILLPEMFSTGFSMNTHVLSESMDGESIHWMKLQAARTGAAIAGSLIIKENDLFFNRFVFAAPNGDLFFYDKKHLFSMGGEDQFFSHGNKRVVIHYKGWRIALFTCYDLRFPVWCRSIRDADLMLFTANWPGIRQHVWQTLLKARAIENQLYIAGVNRTGTDGMGIKYSGESMLIDPRGTIIVNAGDQTDTVATGTVSLEELNRFRKKFPLLPDEDLFEIFG